MRLTASFESAVNEKNWFIYLSKELRWCFCEHVCVCVKRDCRGEMTVRRSVVRRSVSVCSMSQHCSHMHGLVLLRSSSARTVKFRQVTTHHCTVALISWIHLTCWSGKYNSCVALE